MALSEETVERVKHTKFGRAAALSRLEEQVGWPNDVPYKLYKLNSGLFDALDWENNGVESREEFKELFNERVEPLLAQLRALEEYLTLLQEDLNKH